MPDFGEKVHIRPAPEHCPAAPKDAAPGSVLSRVVADGETGRFLPVDGEDVTWTAHHAMRLRHGEIWIVPPAAPAAPPPPKKGKE